MDKTGAFLLGAISGAVALGVTAFLVDGVDRGTGIADADDGASDNPAPEELQKNIAIVKHRFSEDIEAVKESLSRHNVSSEFVGSVKS